MSFNWIDATAYSFNTLLLMDRFLFRIIAQKTQPEFVRNLGIALAYNPAVLWYVLHTCPERQPHYQALANDAPHDLASDEVRASEVFVLDALDWAVVYVYPEQMECLPYIAEWDPERLLSLTNFTGKTVLDIGSGTGRLALAAAPVAQWVYACEPVTRLREYLHEKLRRLDVTNVFVVDGSIECLPFSDDFFDIVVVGHVVGDDYNAECAEMTRVTKHGGVMIDCPGEDDRTRPDGPDQELIQRGFQYSHYTSKTGGDVYRYWKQKAE